MTDGDTGAPVLVLGPLLRYVGETEATIWVETERACEVEVLGHQARTFEVAGHHYALVVIGDLVPGTEYEYQVALDGAVRWPEPDSEFPPSVLRTPDPGRPLRLAFGSCRIAELPVLPLRFGAVVGAGVQGEMHALHIVATEALLWAVARHVPAAVTVLFGSAAEYGPVPPEWLPVREETPARWAYTQQVEVTGRYHFAANAFGLARAVQREPAAVGGNRYFAQS